MRRQGVDGLTLKANGTGAARRRQCARDGLECRCLAGTVGANQRDQLTGAYVKGYVAHRFNTAKRYGQVTHLEQLAHAAPPPR